MGLPDELIEQAREELQRERKQAEVPVWPEHWHAVTAFCAMSSQWRAHALPNGRLFFQGLEYSALPIVLASLRELPHRQPLTELLPQLRVMETAARERLNAD